MGYWDRSFTNNCGPQRKRFHRGKCRKKLLCCFESNKPTQQTINFWFGENVVYTILKANAWTGVTADNFPVVLIFQKKTYKEQLLCYHLLLILKARYNYHCICTSSRVHSEIWGKKITFYHFSKKMPIQRFSPYWSAVFSEKCVVTPSFLFGFQ